MFVLIGDIELYLHGVYSLKEKRTILRSCKDLMRNKFDLIVREALYKDKWQRSGLFCVTAAEDRNFLLSLFDNALEFIS